MRPIVRSAQILLLIIAVLLSSYAWADTMPKRTFIAREGKGYLEKVGTQLVLHLKGNPTEMGRQHGVLLKEHIQSNLKRLDKDFASTTGEAAASRLALADSVWDLQLPYIPERYIDELRALANGADVPFDQARRCNIVPEFFHCSGFALFGKATKDGNLRHGRILDYAVNLGLQDHSVVIIAEPDGYAPFVNVSFAGFIGSVTGMNLNGMAFGELGGGGYGQWDGTPMSVLMRRGLEEAKTLEQAKTLFQNSKRTCRYFYVISDSNIPSAVGVTATPDKIEFLEPNEAKEPLNVPIKDAVVFSADERYKELTKRINEKWGSLDDASCLKLMDRPVSMQSCLHCVLMSPKTKELWVANAASNGAPASEQPYTYLNIAELMAHEPPTP